MDAKTAVRETRGSPQIPGQPGKRHAQLNGTQLPAPVFLHDPVRVEALLCWHFIATLIHALIERQLRQAMKAKEPNDLSLYGEVVLDLLEIPHPAYTPAEQWMGAKAGPRRAESQS